MAAAMAAASSGDAAVWRTSILGRAGCCFPSRGTMAKGYRRVVPEIPVFDHDSVLQALSPLEAIERVREGFLEYATGDWAMPPKLYLDAPPHGDFRAMPARGAGLAILKWVTSFPDNPRAGLPVVMGLICVSSATDGRPLALVDARATTALRTGAVAAVAAQELGREDAHTAGIVGCGLHGSWAGRCLAAAEYPGICFDPDPEAAGRLAGELGWEAGALEDALACDVVTCVTPGAEPVIGVRDLRPGMHLNALGADGPGKAELEVEAVARCELFCDEWGQASHGGELTGAVERRLIGRDRVTELGDVLSGAAPGRSGEAATTLFDSTGLAIQDLAICRAVLEAPRAGGAHSQRLRL
jgi:alanine dehydrogenase